MPKRIAVFAAVAALTVFAAACGSSDDEPSDAETSETSAETSAEAWADDICTSVSTWNDTLTSAGSTLGDPKDLSVNEFKDTVAGVVDATETLAGDLGDLGAPDTEAGAQAQEQLTTLSDNLESEAEELNAATADADTIEELLTNVSTITGSLSAMSADVKTTLDSIAALDGAAELEDAFASAESCAGVNAAG